MGAANGGVCAAWGPEGAGRFPARLRVLSSAPSPHTPGFRARCPGSGQPCDSAHPPRGATATPSRTPLETPGLFIDCCPSSNSSLD